MDDEVEKKRLYNKIMQQNHRSRRKEELIVLKNELVYLQNEVKSLKSRNPDKKQQFSALKWRDVALALDEELERIKKLNGLMVSKSNSNLKMIRIMTRWMASYSFIERQPNPKRTWRDITLLSDSQSRRMGLDWITRSSYFHTYRALDTYFQCPLATPSTPRMEFFLNHDDPDCLKYTWRSDYVSDAPYDAILSFCQTTIFQSHRSLETTNALDTKLLDHMHNNNIRYGVTQKSPREAIKFVTREFSTEKRTVLVGQEVHHDELLSSHANGISRDRSIWIVIERLDSKWTRIRMLRTLSQGHQEGEMGYITLDEEAATLGVDLTHVPTSRKISHLRNVLQRICSNVVVSVYHEFHAAMSQTQCRNET